MKRPGRVVTSPGHRQKETKVSVPMYFRFAFDNGHRGGKAGFEVNVRRPTLEAHPARSI